MASVVIEETEGENKRQQEKKNKTTEKKKTRQQRKHAGFVLVSDYAQVHARAHKRMKKKKAKVRGMKEREHRRKTGNRNPLIRT